VPCLQQVLGGQKTPGRLGMESTATTHMLATSSARPIQPRHAGFPARNDPRVRCPRDVPGTAVTSDRTVPPRGRFAPQVPLLQQPKCSGGPVHGQGEPSKAPLRRPAQQTAFQPGLFLSELRRIFELSQFSGTCLEKLLGNTRRRTLVNTFPPGASPVCPPAALEAAPQPSGRFAPRRRTR